MSKRDDIMPQGGKKPRLAYSCRCGWLDLGHLDSKSYRDYEGASSLWKQIKDEKGKKSKLGGGFQVIYQQSHGKKIRGYYIHEKQRGTYFVRSRLNRQQKESVALAIFQEISMAFEEMQSSLRYRAITDSGFSVEDLISNLIGFYKIVRPNLDVLKICELVSPQTALQIWDTWGAVGSKKNKRFQPVLYPCLECNTKRTQTVLASKAGTHTHGRYSVYIFEDGSIEVERGDWLSKYSAAIYRGDTSKVYEYGRLKGGKLVPIVDVDRIEAGETIYHIPTYEARDQGSRFSKYKGSPSYGKLPRELDSIKPAKKGKNAADKAKLFRDWTEADG